MHSKLVSILDKLKNDKPDFSETSDSGINYILEELELIYSAQDTENSFRRLTNTLQVVSRLGWEALENVDRTEYLSEYLLVKTENNDTSRLCKIEQEQKNLKRDLVLEIKAKVDRNSDSKYNKIPFYPWAQEFGFEPSPTPPSKIPDNKKYFAASNVNLEKLHEMSHDNLQNLVKECEDDLVDLDKLYTFEKNNEKRIMYVLLLDKTKKCKLKASDLVIQKRNNPFGFTFNATPFKR